MAFVNLTLNTKVYGASRIDSNGTAFWVNRDGGIYNSFSNVSLSIVDPTSTKRGRVGVRLDVPIVATEDSVCGCAGTVLRSVTVTAYADIDGSSSSAEKEDALARFIDLVSSTEFHDAFVAFTPPTASA